MQPFVPPTLYPNHEQFHNGFPGNKPSTILPIAPKAPMLPKVSQKPMRKRKAATLRAADWEPYRKRILELHIEQNRSVHEVRQMMEAEHRFKAEVRQYRSRISQWGHDKNVKRHEMQAIVRKHQKRKLIETDKRPLVFEVRGNEVDRQKIERWMKTYDVSGSFLYSPDPAAPTPPAVGCRTISGRGSPAPTTITVYSDSASVMSLDDSDASSHNPHMLSPALSLSGIMRSQTDVLTKQTSDPTHQPHPNLQLSFIYDQNDSTNTDSSVQVIYKRDEEIRLRGDLVIADLTIVSDVPEILYTMYDFEKLLLDQGRYTAAEEVGWRLIDGVGRQVCDGREIVTMFYASRLLVLALVKQGAFAKAETVLRRALQYTDVIEHNHADKARLLDNLGVLLMARGKPAEAEVIFRQSLDMSEKLFGREHPKTINIITRLGILLQERGEFDEAEALLSKTLILLKNVLAPQDYTAIPNLTILVEVLASRIEHKEAEEIYRRVAAFNKRTFGRAHLRTIWSKENLADLLHAQHRYKEAEEVYRESLVLQKQVFGSEHPYTLAIMSKLGAVLYKQTRYEETEVILREVLALHGKVLGFEHSDTLRSMSNLGRVLYMQNRYEEAVVMYTETLALRKKVLGSEHPDTLKSTGNVQRLLERR